MAGMKEGAAKEDTVVGTRLLTVSELARFLSLSCATVYKMAREGAIPSIRVGRSWRFARGAIEQWLAGNPRQGDPNGRR